MSNLSYPLSVTSAPIDADHIPIPANWAFGPRSKAWPTLSRATRLRYSSDWIAGEIKKAEKSAAPRRPEKEKQESWKGTRFTTPYLRAWLKTQPGKTQSSEAFNHKTKRWHDLPYGMDAAQVVQGRSIGHQAGQPGEENAHLAKIAAMPGGMEAAKERYAEGWWHEFQRDQEAPVRSVRWW